MKVVIVIVLSVLLVLSVGLLAYGSTLSNKVTFDPDLGDLLPPVAPDEYAHDIALWIETHLTAESDYGRSFLPGYNAHKDPTRFAAEVDGWFDVFGKHDPASSIPARYSGAELVSHLMVPVTYNNNRSKHFRMASHFEITPTEIPSTRTTSACASNPSLSRWTPFTFPVFGAVRRLAPP